MNTGALRLFQSSGSPNSRRVRIYLAEKGICVALVPVDLGAKEQFSAAYATINPRVVVPTLVLGDGTAIGEVPAIWRYLEEAYPEPPLLGATPKEKALVTMWERRVELEGFASVMEAVRNAAAGLAALHQSGDLLVAVRAGNHFYADLDDRLRSSTFVAGDRFSVADITAFVTMEFANAALGAPVPDDHAATRRWRGAVSSRSSMSA